MTKPEGDSMDRRDHTVQMTVIRVVRDIIVFGVAVIPFVVMMTQRFDSMDAKLNATLVRLERHELDAVRKTELLTQVHSSVSGNDCARCMSGPSTISKVMIPQR